jgi:adenylylsulfate kinase-like enzyme
VAAHDLSGCVIVTGMPGAGKSTVTGLAARLLPKAAQVKGDDMNQMIHSGYVGWMEKPVAEAVRQDELCNRNLCALANNFIDFGWWFDTSALSPDETAKELVTQVSVRAEPVRPGWHAWLRGLHGV